MSLPPPGFGPLDSSSPFLNLVGPIFKCASRDGLRIGVLIQERHCNRRGTAHGGLLATLADITLGYGSGHGTAERPSLTTAGITMEFVGSARVGDWLEGEAEVLRIGSRMGFARCLLTVGDSTIAHASGIFSVRPPR